MGILDTLAESVGSSGVLGRLENGILAEVLQHVLDSDQGGLTAVVAKLRQAGLGDLVTSWLGSGPNTRISAEQLQQVLGNDTVKQLAAHCGLPADTILDHLAEALPHLVDQASPNGTLPPTA
jgi:uncharacterized protein YidB (DUF937 family)